jgi:hypothetical protein
MDDGQTMDAAIMRTEASAATRTHTDGSALGGVRTLPGQHIVVGASSDGACAIKDHAFAFVDGAPSAAQGA